MLRDKSFADFAPMHKILWKRETFSYIEVERFQKEYDYLCGRIPKPDDSEEYSKLYTSEYYQKFYPTFNDFIEAKRYWFRPYALLTEKYGWESRGECGWFGYSSETSESRKEFYENLDKRIKESDPYDDMFVIVDCHI